MRTLNWLSAAIAAGLLFVGPQVANAALICAGCGYLDASTYLGSYDPQSADTGTFHHTDLGLDAGRNESFEDFWVFDLNSGGVGSMSADVTMLTGIQSFMGDLFADGGSTCGGGSCDVVLGALLASGSDSDRRWEIMTGSLPAGRYVLRVSGTTNSNWTSAYTGQLGFGVSQRKDIAESGSMALLGTGLLGLGMVMARRRGYFWLRRMSAATTARSLPN
jgi:hypothetical protein